MFRPVVVLRAALPCALVLLASQTISASIIVGTETGVDTVPSVNVLIELYNDANNPDLPAATEQIDKFETDAFTVGNLSLSDFTFYALSDSVLTNNTVLISDAFVAGNLVEISDADFNLEELDLRVVAFTYDGVGPAPFNYYVSKNGQDYSLWTLMPGFNPVYVEVSPSDLFFEPNTSGVSHISFYGPTGPTINEIPEPASASLAGLGLLSSLWFARRAKAA